MRTKTEILSLLTSPGVIAVVRLKDAAQVLPVCEALAAGGVRALEITLTNPSPLDSLREVAAKLGAKAAIGAGSVLNVEQCREALAAGAEFIVSPILRAEIAAAAHAADRPVMLGGYTPTEAQSAHEAGADFVKVFPADSLGASYLKSLRAPMPHLKLVPTGGVTLRNIGDFFKAGCPAVAVGSSLLDPGIIERGNWRELMCRAGEFVAAAQAAQRAK